MASRATNEQLSLRNNDASLASAQPARSGHRQYPPAATSFARGGISPHSLRLVRDYVDAHLEEKVCVGSLAEIAGLSKYHFTRAFKASVGETPASYVLRCRIE